MNQIELHPWLQQKELREYCESEGIVVMVRLHWFRWSRSWGILSRAQRQVRGAQGYCPIARAERFEHTPLFAIANQLGKTEAQVAIRWSLQQGCVTIPKSSNTDRIRENASVFDFTIPAVRACFPLPN